MPPQIPIVPILIFAGAYIFALLSTLRAIFGDGRRKKFVLISAVTIPTLVVLVSGIATADTMGVLDSSFTYFSVYTRTTVTVIYLFVAVFAVESGVAVYFILRKRKRPEVEKIIDGRSDNAVENGSYGKSSGSLRINTVKDDGYGAGRGEPSEEFGDYGEEIIVVSPTVKMPVFRRLGKKILSVLPLRKYKKKGIGFSELIFMGGFAFICTVLFMFYHSVYFGKIVIFDDYPFHFMETWIYLHFNIPQFGGSVHGFCNFFYAGFPAIPYFNPGLSMFAALLNLFGIGVTSVYQIYIAVAVFCIIIIPYFLGRKFGFPPLIAFFGGLTSFIATFWAVFVYLGYISSVLGSFIFIAVIYGLYSVSDYDPQQIGSFEGSNFPQIIVRGSTRRKRTDNTFSGKNRINIFSFIGASFREALVPNTVLLCRGKFAGNGSDLSETDVKRNKKIGITFLLGILFGIEIVTMNESLIYYALTVIAGLLYWIIISGKINLVFLFRAAAAALIALGVSAFYWIPIVFYNLHLLSEGNLSIFLRYITGKGLPDYVLSTVTQFLHEFNRDNISIFIFGIPVYLIPPVIAGAVGLFRTKGSGFPRFITLTAAVLGLYAAVFSGVTFSISTRALFLCNFVVILSIPAFLNDVVKAAGKMYLSMGRGVKSPVYVFSFVVLIIISLNITLPRIYNGWNFTDMPDDVSAVYEWLAEHPSDTRVLIEDSTEITGNKWHGRLPALGPILTGYTFIGGYYSPGVVTPNMLYATSYDGMAFGVKYSRMNISYYTEMLNFFNIMYIIIWSDDAAEFLRRYPDMFTELHIIGNFVIYNFTAYNGSYIHPDRPDTLTANLRIEQNFIGFDIIYAQKGTNITLSFTDFPNWHIYLNGTGIRGRKDPRFVDFISFTVPETGRYRVEIRWEKTVYESVSEIISPIFIVAAGSIAYILISVKKTEKRDG